MRLATTLFSILALSLVACGGDDGGGDDQPNLVDANDNTDPPDAAPVDPGVSGLGQVCTTAGTECTTGDATICAELDDPPNGGFCTLSCGTTGRVPDPIPQDFQPPADGQQICGAAYMGDTGTPVCAIYQNAEDATVDEATWYCAVACGTFNGQNLGDCPGGLTCQANFCDD